jgi:hypothetical protein
MEFNNKLKPNIIRLYHSSPYDFEKPDPTKLKRNDLSYSFGFYTADNPKSLPQYGNIDYEFDYVTDKLFDIDKTYPFSQDVVNRIKQEVPNYKRGLTWDVNNEEHNKHWLSKDRIINTLNALAIAKDTTLTNLLKELGVGDFDAAKIPIRKNYNYYVINDPSNLKLVNKKAYPKRWYAKK